MSIFEDRGYVRETRATKARTVFQEDVLLRTGEVGVRPRPFDRHVDLRETRLLPRRAIPRPVRVLIVDDSLMFGGALNALLETDERVTVVGKVESGEAAVLHAALSEVDVALVDLGLPGIDGIELTRRLLSLSPQLRVIVLSGNEDPATKKRALAAGAVAVFLKGGLHEELVDTVAAAARITGNVPR